MSQVNELDTGLPDRAKEWIDGKVHDGLKTVGRGGLAVLGAGFGKGVLVAATLIAVGGIGLALFAPEIIGIGAASSVGLAVSSGVTAAANAMFSLGGLLALAAGGTAGSLVAAHTENHRIGREAAEEKAAAYARARAACCDEEQLAALQSHDAPQQEQTHFRDKISAPAAYQSQQHSMGAAR